MKRNDLFDPSWVGEHADASMKASPIHFGRAWIQIRRMTEHCHSTAAAVGKVNSTHLKPS